MKRFLIIVLKGSAVIFILIVLWTFAYPHVFPKRFQEGQQAYQDFVRTNALAK